MIDRGSRRFAALASTLLLIVSFAMAPPALSMTGSVPFISLANTTMSNRLDAQSKDAEGKLESAYGDLTGDTGHKVKGKAKQMQASAMNAAEDLKEGAKSVAKKVADAASDLADKID
ncbi:MAG: CsbD family protein [Cyanobacteriota bacterium]|jgi:uncharacterized protein YjbJ (UPF0337 family)